MASIVKPITSFHKTTERVKNLIDEANRLEINQDTADDIRRGAIVLMVAAFDRYFTSKFCDVLIDHLRKGHPIGKNLADLLQKSGLDTVFALDLVFSDRPLRKIRTIVQNHLSKHTTQRVDAIDDLFLCIGLKNLCLNAEKVSGKKKLLRKIELLVDLRNEVAHEAHVARNGEPRAFNRDRVKNWMDGMQLVVEACDDIINKKYGNSEAVSV